MLQPAGPLSLQRSEWTSAHYAKRRSACRHGTEASDLSVIAAAPQPQARSDSSVAQQASGRSDGRVGAGSAIASAGIGALLCVFAHASERTAVARAERREFDRTLSCSVSAVKSCQRLSEHPNRPHVNPRSLSTDHKFRCAEPLAPAAEPDSRAATMSAAGACGRGAMVSPRRSLRALRICAFARARPLAARVLR